MQETSTNTVLQRHVFTLAQVSVCWRSILQSTIALSTIALSMTMMEAMKEVIWLQRLLDDLRIDQNLLKINCDSMNAIYLAKNQVYHVRMKHIDVKFHFFQEILKEGDIELWKIHTKENPADMLTNVVPRVKFAHFKELLYIFQSLELDEAHLDELQMAWSSG